MGARAGVRHLLWGVFFVVLNAGLVAMNLLLGNVFFAGFVAALIPLALAVVFLGWRSERRSDERMAELAAMAEVERRVRRREAERAATNGEVG